MGKNSGSRSVSLAYSPLYKILKILLLGFPGNSVVENSPANAGDIRDIGSISRSGRWSTHSSHKELDKTEATYRNIIEKRSTC